MLFEICIVINIVIIYVYTHVYVWTIIKIVRVFANRNAKKHVFVTTPMNVQHTQLLETYTFLLGTDAINATKHLYVSVYIRHRS